MTAHAEVLAAFAVLALAVASAAPPVAAQAPPSVVTAGTTSSGSIPSRLAPILTGGALAVRYAIERLFSRPLI